MDFIESGVLSGEVLPILLGNSTEGFAFAHRVFRSSKSTSHVFCEKPPFLSPFLSWLEFHTIPKTLDDRLLCEALLDFASQYQHTDTILYLIPCTERYAGMLWYHGAKLESHFVIGDTVPFAATWLEKGRLKGGDV